MKENNKEIEKDNEIKVIQEIVEFVNNKSIKEANYAIEREKLIKKLINDAKEQNIKLTKSILRESFRSLEKNKKEEEKKAKNEKAKKEILEKINISKKRKGNVHDVKIEWFDTEITEKGYEFPTNTWQNANAILDAYNIKVKYNVISREIEFDVNNNQLKYIEKASENARLEEIRSLFAIQRYKVNYDTLNMQLNAIADKNAYNPVKLFLEKAELNWDKNDRLKELYETVEVDNNFCNDLKEKYIKKWLLNCVRQAHNEHSRFGSYGVLVFQGRQNLGKTRWIKRIIPNIKWLKGESNINIESKDSLMENTKYWIVELGELDASMKNEQSKMKAFLTRESDEFRKPYAKLSEKYPRYTTFYASVNPKQFLKDETGNRRYWVIPCVKLHSDHNIDINQLWGQVMYLYKNAKSKDFYLTDDEVEILNETNKEFTVSDDVDIYIEDLFDFNTPKQTWTNFMSSAELLKLLKQKDIKINANKIKNALNKKGIEQSQPRYKGKKTRGYYLPSLIEIEIDEKTNELLK